jgi:hypothetical protein
MTLSSASFAARRHEFLVPDPGFVGMFVVPTGVRMETTATVDALTGPRRRHPIAARIAAFPAVFPEDGDRRRDQAGYDPPVHARPKRWKIRTAQSVSNDSCGRIQDNSTLA